MQFQWTVPLRRVFVDGEIYLHLRIKSTGGEDQKTQVDKLKRAVISLASKICHHHWIFVSPTLQNMPNFTGIDGFTTHDHSTIANIFTYDETVIP